MNLKRIDQIPASLSHLFFPQLCLGCGSDLVQRDQLLCLHCEVHLNDFHFSPHPNNQVEKIFHGRLRIKAATSAFYFVRDSLVQQLIHQLKYGNQVELGKWMGLQIANALLSSGRFDDVTALLPMPLFAARQKKRGYNQATVLCEGFASLSPLPVLSNSVIRNRKSATQTHKTRWERWHNVDGIFEVRNPDLLENQHVLLIDDVITTGATLEACGRILSALPGLHLSIATFAYADK
jgi:ComF family protein